MGEPDHAMEPMRTAMHNLRARRQQERIAQLREAAYDTGKAALGFETARYAAERGAIAELIFSESAWRKHPDGIESLVRDALAEGAQVEWAEPAAERELDGKINGVVALLRFPLVPMG
jgi:stalled ribosome rescue protein Dom34